MKLSTLLCCALPCHVMLPAAMAFVSLPLRSSTHLFYADENKLGRVEIEEAAGQDRNTADANAGTTTQKGLQHVNTQEPCQTYGCELQDPELKARFEKLCTPRPYPLFLVEKATKLLQDLLRGNHGPELESVLLEREPCTNGGQKEKLVVLGSGWGAAALLQGIDADRYDVTCISPRNYFLFTPLLAGASVGTVDVRSITRPIREFNRNANYLEAAASSIDLDSRVVICNGIVCGDECAIEEFEVPYDRLVVAVGARINTFGIDGVEEHCLFLKQLEDARQVRRNIVNLFEQANFPGVSEELKRKLLTFAIIGAGPTGIELAAELRDFIEEDGPKFYPHLLRYVSLKVIEAGQVVLRPFDESLRKVAVDALLRPVESKNFPQHGFTELLLNKRVQAVTNDEIVLEGDMKIPYGLAVWAGGIGPLPITIDIVDAIGGSQRDVQKFAPGKIGVDPWLRALDTDSRIFALGDCIYMQEQCLPSTAQVAAQEGEFLARLLSVSNFTSSYEDGVLLPPLIERTEQDFVTSVMKFATGDDDYMEPFQYLDMGILAYTGGFSALAQVQLSPKQENRMKIYGPVGFGLWRSIYFFKQASLRNRVLLALDWCKARLFGRDITMIE